MANAPIDDADGRLDLHYGHPRMPLSERAKIFTPFDPLEGFREAIEEQERMSEQGLDPRGNPAEGWPTE